MTVIKSIVIFLMSPMMVFANLPDMTSKISRLESNLSIKDRKLRSLQAEIFKLSQEEKSIVSEAEILSSKVSRVTESIRQYSKFLKRLKLDLKEQRRILQKRLRVLLKWHKNSFVDFMLSADSISTLDQKLRVVKNLTQNDIYMLKNYRSNKIKFSDKTLKLKAKLKKLSLLKAQVDRKSKRLAKVRDLSLQKVTVLRRQHKISLNKLLEMRKNHKQLLLSGGGQSFQTGFLKKRFIELKGDLPFPVTGHIIKNFGADRIGETNIDFYSKGIIFKAKPGAEVKSVAAGKVSFIGKLLGYGKTVIVNQGYNYYVVYGNLNDIKVEEGQNVNSSDLIATVNSKTVYEKSGLYFEIRHFTDPVDPSKWFGNTIKVSASTSNGKFWQRKHL